MVKLNVAITCGYLLYGKHVTYHFMAGNNDCLLISTPFHSLRPSAASLQLEHHGRQLFCVSPLGGTLRIWICAGMHGHSVWKAKTEHVFLLETISSCILLILFMYLFLYFLSNSIDTRGSSLFRKLPTYFGIINTFCEPKVKKIAVVIIFWLLFLY